jgi:hypothetical protein
MPRPKSTPERTAFRFWSKVDRSGGPDACWPYMAGGGSYGSFWDGEKSVGAHAFAFFLDRGCYPAGCACHNCPNGDNRRCCNPAHLWDGTIQENNEDRDRKGGANQPRGERNAAARMTATKVIDARIRFERGGVTMRALAREHGISLAAIQKILKRETWAHV